ncbi:inactive tyrosine-protein kinase PRAG1 isoform X1 [Chelonia mydas]|uniref:inactive tyrosine-protein kinase PRAG1 isoform X1 n=2 Tax=Chelonia mydas TaxID=8469 RepID=UPI0018A21DFD|nr:inactive tyrosine-protein kinase PRAG1 isoform X1 [Chelonia mydas]XP_043401208.1 inactive tyrosine-protein kinase PRAG1 isoform X1 [Chelonia mydas]XP_043401209.1 inactive tyrosine-protein kinase PRAG1 isoform X1 [Chelonia mydas]XP_043401210.1 inactive tyrosine-protein kinase PRAG1 isoform X1 [Chelonia mydas]
MQNEQQSSVHKMQRAICLNQEDLKMSVCSNFVEHIWKPGSCKNCFYSKRSHRLQASLELEASSLPSRTLNGIRTKAEDTALEDECVTAAPYSKPTIAVKPTMINPDVSDIWADVNMNADISQVSWRMASETHLIVKPGEAQRTCLDHFSTSAVRKPFVHDTPNDCAPQYLPGCSRAGLENRGERNIPFNSSVLESEMGGWEGRAMLRNKEKLACPQKGLCHQPSIFADRSTDSTPDSTGCPAFRQREGTPLSSESSDSCCSPGSESESGEYCSIADYCRESPVPLDAPCPQSKVAWHDSEKPALRFWGQQEAAGKPLAKTRAVKFCEDECRPLNLDSSLQREHCLQDSLQNNTRSERKTLALISGTTALSDSVASSNSSSSPLTLPQENNCCPLLEQSSLVRDNSGENSSDSLSTVPAPQHAPHTQPAHSEPIYAESTKRKKAQVNNSGVQTKREGPARSPLKEQAHGPWRDGVRYLSSEREYQDSATQVAAKITIMAAHTDEDNRTIFLSSPDSAVGVQWPCSSPTSHPDFAIPSPSFGHREGSQAGSEVGSGESSPRFHQQTQSKGVVNESPAVPPKMSTSSPPGSEGTTMPSVKSPGAELCDSNGHGDTSTQFSSRNCTDPSALGTLPSLCSHSNRVSAEEPNRGPPGSSHERRHKYCGAGWSRQCRIEEEEEEEQGFLTCTQAREVENGTACPHHGEDCSGQDKKTGMSKSASFAFEFPKDSSETEEFAPPPPPPKKQPRHALKMNKSSSELEKVSNGSAESLGPPFQGIHVSFVAGSTESLNSDTRTASDGGSNQDRSPGSPLQPPPLPQKKTVSRAVSSPDGFFWGQAPLGRTANPTSPRLNISHSESNVCVRRESPFCYVGSTHHSFSSSESLENACKGNGHWGPTSNKSSSACVQNRNLQPFSSSPLSASSQVSSVSSLQLRNLLLNIDSKEGVYAKLGGLYAESLRRLVAKCEDCFMRDQKNELHFNENNWSLFKLACNKPCCVSGDAIYYCATCSKDPSSTYAVKICKTQESKVSASYHSPSVPVHFNIQQDCGHFVASVPFSMLLSSDAAKSTSPPEGPGLSHSASERDCVVVITREVPHQTTADFMRDAATCHQTKPEVYERRVCFLLLQLCHGLEHLKEHGIIHRDLCLENLLLVHCKPLTGCSKTKDEKHLPRLIVSNFLKAKQKPGAGDSKLKKSQARLAPEIVSASQYKKFDEFQTGILIYELLHQPNPFEVRAHLREQEYSQDDLPPLPNLSIYSRGLQQLAHLLLEADPIKRVCITEAKWILQCLLWGPRKDLTDQPLNHEEALYGALQNWIDMKRALLMMKFAERAVDTERSIELEDWLCCQYLASADPAFLFNTLKLLQLL